MDPILRERRIVWIDEMILMVPEFVRTHQFKTQPIHFFFIYSSGDQTVLYRASSCPCGICFDEKYGILSRFEEKDWASFQKLIKERLAYFDNGEKLIHEAFHNHVVTICPMQAIRDTCIAWMLDQPVDLATSNFRFDF